MLKIKIINELIIFNFNNCIKIFRKLHFYFIKKLKKMIRNIRIIFVVCLVLYSYTNCYAFLNDYNFFGYSQIDYSVSNNVNDNQAKFEITRLNLIGDFNLNPNARFVTDIELEHNLNIASNGNIGVIKFSQVWAEYSFLPEFKLRAGKILTNFGLYNKIHDASPTYFSINSPYIYSRFSPNNTAHAQRFYGKYILGIEATGTLDIDENGTQLEYSFMFGNGRNDFVGNSYLDNNTAFASRIYLTPSFLRGFQIGCSVYGDKNEMGIANHSNGVEITPALELQYEYQDFQFQGEVFFPSFKDSVANNQNSILSYIHFAYTLFDVLTPYTQFAFLEFGGINDNKASQIVLGLNYAISNNFFIKAEAQYNTMEMGLIKTDFGSLKSSLSIAF